MSSSATWINCSRWLPTSFTHCQFLKLEQTSQDLDNVVCTPAAASTPGEKKSYLLSSTSERLARHFHQSTGLTSLSSAANTFLGGSLPALKIYYNVHVIAALISFLLLTSVLVL